MRGDQPGSSPRVWGALPDFLRTLVYRRLIPTCVGSTWSFCRFKEFQTAHPHVCGEHPFKGSITVSRTGSSPRVWGAHGRVEPQDSQHRLIPTCVGSTPFHSKRSHDLAAHPHVCGEHPPLEVWRMNSYGSSPRVWGALWGNVLKGMQERLIPTCVGSTRRRTRRGTAHTAHPHVCGEH